MWEERVTNEIWYTENFIDEKLVDEVLENIKKSDTKELDGNEQPHIISKSYYNYNHIKYNIHENSKLVVQIITKLNEVLEEVYKPILIQDINPKNVLQFTTKTKLSNFSRAAKPIAPSDSGSSISPSPRNTQIFLPSSLTNPLLIRYFKNLA